MPTIDFGDGRRIRVPDGSSVLRASLAAGLRQAHACGGRGRCTTCRVRVERGAEACPPPGRTESEALQANGLEPSVRLACQLRPIGDVSVRILIEAQDSRRRELPEALEEQVAALFIDLRGFTRFAETHLPFDVSSVLNRYFDIMGALVERHHGHILDYLGDGMMVLFRPGDGGDAEPPCERAARCALALRRAGHRFATYVEKHFQTRLGVGIAIHTGRAVVGDMGYFRERHLNAVGDVLNVAARLEDHNKECGTDVLISALAARACGDRIRCGRSFELGLRGRGEPVEAFELLDPSEP